MIETQFIQTIPKVQVLVGMIASGKSTYSRHAARQGHLCLNDDAIVNLLHSDEYTLYDKNLKVFYKALENNIVAMALAMKRVIVIDRGLNVSLRGRKRWLALADSFDVPCEAIVFTNQGAPIHAARRAKHDARGHDYEYWLEVAFAHDREWCIPTEEEGFSRVHYADYNIFSNGTIFQ